MTTHPVPVGTGRWLSSDLETHHPAEPNATAFRGPGEPLPRRTPGLVYAEINNRDWQGLVDARPVISTETIDALWRAWSPEQQRGLLHFAAGYAPGCVLAYAEWVERKAEDNARKLQQERFGE